MEPNPNAKRRGDIAPIDWVLDQLQRDPITVSPWKIAQFFENEDNIDEKYLDKSLEQLAELHPNFEKNNREMVEGLEKAALLAVPMFRKLPLMTLITIIREASSSSQVFSLLPDFPKVPAKNLIQHIYPDDSMTSDEKTVAFQEIAKNTTNVLEHLVSWRNQVVSFVEGLDKFVADYGAEMSQEQKDHVDSLLQKTRSTVPQIDVKIAEKRIRSNQELEEFERFYRVMSKEPKWSQYETRVARGLIQTVYDDSDHSMRTLVARMADVETSTTGSDGGSETGGEQDDQMNGRKRKRPASNETTVRPKTDRPTIITVVARANKPIDLKTLKGNMKS